MKKDIPDGMQMFKDVPPEFDRAAKTYRKKVLTRAVRVHGPFMVHTSEGPLTCQDGYLAKDARGYLYPIAKEEFELIYEPVNQPDPHKSDPGSWP